jgi:hypothetical protein
MNTNKTLIVKVTSSLTNVVHDALVKANLTIDDVSGIHTLQEICPPIKNMDDFHNAVCEYTIEFTLS